MGGYWKKLACIWVWRHVRMGSAPHRLGVGAPFGGLLLLVARLRPHGLAGDDVAPFQPAMEIDVGAPA
jgi:hypothetical protein